MAENDNPKKTYQPRRNPPQRPPPGVQKAINNFGVSDLRQLLDQKHKEQGEKPIDPKNIPPPDPSYNYLRDPARDKPRAPQSDNRKPRPKSHENTQKNNSTEEIATKDIDNEKPKTSNFRGRHPRKGNPHFPRDNQTTLDNTNDSNFRGRNPRRGRGNGRPKANDNPETTIDFLNIKIEVSSETGQRSCVLDEDTKIADIKHVPDHQSPIRRGSPRGRRGSFRGRGRGYYRGRGGFSNNKLPENNAVATEEAHDNENELSSEYNDDSEEQAQFDPNLTETITVTSSKLPNNDAERLVEVKLDGNSELEKNTHE